MRHSGPLASGWCLPCGQEAGPPKLSRPWRNHFAQGQDPFPAGPHSGRRVDQRHEGPSPHLSGGELQLIPIRGSLRTGKSPHSGLHPSPALCPFRSISQPVAGEPGVMVDMRGGCGHRLGNGIFGAESPTGQPETRTAPSVLGEVREAPAGHRARGWRFCGSEERRRVRGRGPQEPQLGHRRSSGEATPRITGLDGFCRELWRRKIVLLGTRTSGFWGTYSSEHNAQVSWLPALTSSREFSSWQVH